tara:strand:- start:5766 stop:6185 length:420 start_codon:yes stop_codon:yes gene_type:complete
MSDNSENLFEKAMERYKSGEDPANLINDFELITSINPNYAAGWTCLAWLQLLCDNSESALKSAKIAVKLNKQDPQARINLSLALLQTNSVGVRDHIDYVKQVLVVVPDFQKELQESIQDGLQRKPNWLALEKVKRWLDI